MGTQVQRASDIICDRLRDEIERLDRISDEEKLGIARNSSPAEAREAYERTESRLRPDRFAAYDQTTEGLAKALHDRIVEAGERLGVSEPPEPLQETATVPAEARPRPDTPALQPVQPPPQTFAEQPVPATIVMHTPAPGPINPVVPGYSGHAPMTPQGGLQQPMLDGAALPALSNPMAHYPPSELVAWQMRAQAAEQELNYARYQVCMMQNQVQQLQHGLQELQALADRANAKALSAEQLALKLSKSRNELQQRYRQLEAETKAA